MKLIESSPILVLLVIVNVVSLLFFGVDKLRSMRRGWRISESRLLLAAFFGPFGAYGSMLLFRHKTRKTRFFLVPFFLLIQSCLIVYFLLMRNSTVP
jgi:uncharacterized membrane protein YsdA (DUF1294 family)